MSGDKLHRLQRCITDLSVFVHTELSNLAPDDSQDPHADLNHILNLDPADALTELKAKVSELVKFKRDVMLTREYDDFKTMQQYQTALQKLESEVRNHIKIEQQLKIHIENTQGRMEEMEHESEDRVEKLRKENRLLMEQIKAGGHSESQEPLTSREHLRKDDKNKLLQELMQLRHSAKKDQSRMSELEKRIGKLEAEVIMHKSAVIDKERESERLKRDLEKYKTAVSRMKENISSTAELRPDSSKRSLHGHVDREDGRSVSPLAMTTQNRLKLTQRCSSMERLKTTNRPATATKRMAAGSLSSTRK